ncbi:hypothetical protein D6855_16575 [Butyrivibrio sp. CB08]|uniref:hypothetical protein n=1 Tax=Butyrivibrio sp. CB08 TaxID=2364879 RepID=UPI000EA926CB|nr:hypothetical protein [Butyrivibrio sp. CB08]RKM55066.1 hypothetical protein D6855_16575 [Butyrivibrio sp. CB08]
MLYTKEERLAIGEQLYKHEIRQKDAMAKYNISKATAEKYLRAYKEHNGIPIIAQKSASSASEMQSVKSKSSVTPEMEEYMSMSKEELIRELVQAKANELRAKKGYEVKGAGANKEFVPLNNKNSKS